MTGSEHWRATNGETTVILHTKADAEAHTQWGWAVEGPFAPADQLQGLRDAVRAYLNGAPLDESGRFKDPAREALYRAAGGDRS